VKINPGSEFLASSLEQQVLLEAVAAPSTRDDLALQIGHIERNRVTLVRAEVLEGDGVHVSTVHLTQVGATTHAEDFKVCAHVVHVGLSLWIAGGTVNGSVDRKRIAGEFVMPADHECSGTWGPDAGCGL
jgi:hypothetical protein